MSVGRFLQQAAAGNAGEAVYVDDVFSTYLFDGTGSAQTITNGIDVDGEGGMVWIKRRDASSSHLVWDTERGNDVKLSTDLTSAEASGWSPYFSFTSSGFNVDAFASSSPYASWTFRKQPGFFDVVTWTGDGTSNRAISHSVGAEVGMMLVKRLNSSQDWNVYHRSLDSVNPADYRLLLNTTNAKLSANSGFGTGSGTPPTTTEFTVSANLNLNGDTYVCYLFAHDAQDFGTDSDESIIKCGSFTTDSSGNASVNLGFEPQWILIKKTNSTGSWGIMDSMRGFTYDGTNKFLFPDLSNAETDNSLWDIRNDGFNLNSGGSTNTFIYVAIRRPHKPASEFAATDLFAIDTRGGTAPTPPNYVSGFPVDMELHKDASGNGNWRNGARLMQGKYLEPNSTAAEGTDTNMTAFDFNNGFRNSTTTSSSKYAWMFRRAPGFFDVVAYTGEIGASGTGHNLGVTPEFIIVKRRDGTSNWRVWHKDLGSTESLILNSTSAVITGGSYFKDPPADADKIYPGGAGDVNTSGVPYITYLFATVPGISKVGSYTGTGADVDVDCGFSAGARFVLVKSTGSGHWILWDTVRGIVAGNDPYLALSATFAQISNGDYIDPLSSGFTITSSAPSSLNQSGRDYIFLAIA